MKAIIVITIFVTAAIIFWQYSRSKNTKKLMLSLFSMILIVSLGVMGNITRPVIPLFIAHIILTIVAWGGLGLYILRNRYYWWIILLPAITIVLFLLLEVLTGSRHEYLGNII